MEENKLEQFACFTGYSNECGNFEDAKTKTIVKYFTKVIDSLVSKGVKYFVSGADSAIAVLFAYAVNLSKSKHPDIKNFIAIPFKNQFGNYKEGQKKFYDFIFKVSDRTISVNELKKYHIELTGEQSYTDALKKRNEFIVDYSGYIVALVTDKDGEAKNCLNYANKLKRKIIVADINNGFKTKYYNFKK